MQQPNGQPGVYGHEMMAGAMPVHASGGTQTFNISYNINMNGTPHNGMTM